MKFGLPTAGIWQLRQKMKLTQKFGAASLSVGTASQRSRPYRTCSHSTEPDRRRPETKSPAGAGFSVNSKLIHNRLQIISLTLRLG